MFKFLKKILDPNEWELNKIKKYVEMVNALEPEMEKLSDEELKAKTPYFKELLAQGKTLEDILPEAFAVVREVSRRTIGLRHFDVQIIGGVVLHQGRIAEMKTGEGKTLVATLPVYLNALTGKGVHVVTVNDYLAKRDARWMGPIYHFLGLTVGVIQHEAAFQFDPEYIVGDASLDLLRSVSRREAYYCDVTYGTNNEFGFDYLRDNMVMSLDDRVQRELAYAIVDEVDSILIDEARTPLIISGRGTESSENYRKFARIASRLEKDKHYTVFEKEHNVTLTDEGYKRIAEYLGLPRKRTAQDYEMEVPFVFPDLETPEELEQPQKDTISGNGEIKKLMEKGSSLTKRKKFSMAIKVYDELIEKDPENLTAWIRKGIAYDKWGKKSEAIECIQKVIPVHPDFVRAIGKDGINYDVLRQLEASLQKASTAVKVEDEAPEGKTLRFIAFYNKGNSALKNGDPSGASTAYIRSLDFNPNSVEALNNLGVAYLRLGNTTKAFESLQKALDSNPNAAEVWFNLGCVHQHAGMIEKAMESYSKAYEKNPRFPGAYNNEAILWLKMGDSQKALELFTKAVEIEESVAKEKGESIRESYFLDNLERAKAAIDEGSSEMHSKFPGYEVSEQEEADIEYYISNALKAKEIYKRDVDYVVKDDQIIIVDEFTGRLMFGRRYSDGLHQAIEAKENVKVRSEDQTLASITFQNYFRMYAKLAGMTGTAATEEKEFREIYNMDVVVIPTNKEMIRIDLPDRIYKSEEAKFRAVIAEIEEMNRQGRPVLVGTRSIEKSEILSNMLKKKGIKHNVLNAKHHEREAQIIAEAGRVGAVTIATNMAGRGVDIILGGVPPSAEIEHRKFISAKRHFELITRQLDEMRSHLAEKTDKLESLKKQFSEAQGRILELRKNERTNEIEKQIEDESKLIREIEAEIQRVNEEIRDLKTRIQNNVSILPELEKTLETTRKEYEEKEKLVAEQLKEYVKEQEKVKQLGGLHIIGTERHESRRIDNQLRGRAGRQGDPGSSRFYVALDDELMRLFGSDKLPEWLKDWADDETVPLEHKLFTSSIQKAQEKVESHHFDIRKSVLDYDNVMNEQRKVIYAQRDRILRGENIRPVIESFIEATIDGMLHEYTPEGFPFEEWDLESLYRSCKETFIPLPPTASVSDLELTDRKKIKKQILEWAMYAYDTREARLGSDLMREVERWIVLQIVDQKWMDHLATLDQLREGIGLRAYGQKDPLVEYINESHEYFQAMNHSIQMDTIKFLFRIQVKGSGIEERHQKKMLITREHRGEDAAEQGTVRKGRKVGRNELCPCGSGKKFKRCCGRA